MSENGQLTGSPKGLISLEDGMKWFDDADPNYRDEIVRSLDLCIFQSHQTAEDIQKGILLSGLKETYSPCVLVTKRPFNEAIQKILKLAGLDQ